MKLQKLWQCTWHRKHVFWRRSNKIRFARLAVVVYFFSQRKFTDLSFLKPVLSNSKMHVYGFNWKVSFEKCHLEMCCSEKCRDPRLFDVFILSRIILFICFWTPRPEDGLAPIEIRNLNKFFWRRLLDSKERKKQLLKKYSNSNSENKRTDKKLTFNGSSTGYNCSLWIIL